MTTERVIRLVREGVVDVVRRRRMVLPDDVVDEIAGYVGQTMFLVMDVTALRVEYLASEMRARLEELERAVG